MKKSFQTAFACCRFLSKQRFQNAFFATLLFFAPLFTFAERLPLKLYTTENGLAQNVVNRVVRDSRGFLWFCTEDGLSRFDGQTFVNYDTSSGLPHPQVNHVLETREGEFWLATNGGGIVRFDISPKPSNVSPFKTVPILSQPEKALDTNRVNYLYQDRAGVIWAGTFVGLFRLEKDGEQEVFRRVALPPGDAAVSVRGFTEDENNNLWMWSRNGVFRRQPNGQITHYSIHPDEKYDSLRGIFADQNGKIWIAHEQAGLFVFDLDRLTQLERSFPQDFYLLEKLKPAISNWFGKGKELPENSIFSLFQSSDRHLWIGTATGLSEFDGANFHNYARLQGLPETPFNWLNEDINGNIWATTNQGAVKLTRSGFVTFQQNENLGVRGVRSVWESESGELQVLTPTGTFHQLDGQNFATVKPRLPENTTFEFPQNAIRDARGEIWVATKTGLLRFPQVKKLSDLSFVAPQKIKNLPGDYIMNLYEDSRQNIWISLADSEPKLICWERATETLRFFTATEGVPPDFTASAFAEDDSQTLWIGGSGGGLLRYREGRFEFFTTTDGVPFGQVQTLFFDRKNQLWIGTKGGGVGKISEPNVGKPIFSLLTTKDGISSNAISSVIEDEWGRIYLGTGRGLDWIEPNSGNIGHYSTIDGLNDNKIEIAFRDHGGALWFGTANSLARFAPQPQSPASLSPPAVFITKLRIGETPVPLAELGQREIKGIEVGAAENQVVIDFASLDFAAGQTLRFRHKLIGAATEWSQATAARSVNLANLAPGSYQFLVQAVTLGGAMSDEPAVVSFKILPPLYLRWWFLLAVGILTAMFTYGFYRYRVNKLLEIERTRTRIATDLHDDIGANLSKISLLSEVVKMQLAGGNAENNRLLTTIADVSRDSVNSMRDIVWAINPNRDSVLEMTRKMREYVEEVFVPRNVAVEFRAPDETAKIKLSMNVRRELFLIFKEAVINAARHSGCTQIKISFRLERGKIFLDVADNGRGFEDNGEFAGNGLTNMKSRAEKIAGTIEIQSRNTQGTIIKISASQK